MDHSLAALLAQKNDEGCERPSTKAELKSKLNLDITLSRRNV